jgi:two-component system alkaline phosphatase synthesis response regulator PhoP
MNKILVVEDNTDLAAGLEINLKKEGYKVIRVTTGEEGIKSAIHDCPDLILLDIMLPGISGLDVCRDLRQKSIGIPIIMLTAKGDELDRVVGLELGADDYVAKPFGVRELLARIRVCLRRQPGQAQLSRYRFGNVDIDFEKYKVSVGKKQVEFTQKEFELMRCFVQNREAVLSRDRLLDEVWGYDSYPTTRTVDMHIVKLRKKIEQDPASPLFILSVYGGGYKFVG